MPDPEPRQQLLQLIDGYRNTALLYTAATLDIADLIGEEPCGADALAARLSLDAGALRRLLRGLAAIGVLLEEGDDCYSLTPLGEELRAQSSGGLREQAILAGAEYMPAWGALPHAMRTGEAAFPHVFGMGAWEHRKKNTELNDVFNAGLTMETSAAAQAIVRARDFSGAGVVVDIGGGRGALIAAILGANPGLKGILFDQAAVIAQAGPVLLQAGVAERCRIHEGDFFTAVPEGAGLYLLKSILHDWDDERCREILQNCRKAMGRSGRLLVIERILPARAVEDPATIMLDLHMLAVPGGRERPLDEYRQLAMSADLEFLRTIPAGGFQILEFQPRA
jgi:hypothetical protein